VVGGDSSSFSINGLMVSGGAFQVPAKDNTGKANLLKQLAVLHCTLSPTATLAIGTAPAQPAGPRLLIEASDVNLMVDHSIVGGIRIADDSTATICNSIIDALAETVVAYAAADDSSGGGALTVQNTTMIGKVHALRIDLASNTIFAAELESQDLWQAPVWADQLQQGCVRFSYVPAGSRTPRRYECHPSEQDTHIVRPAFTSLRFGDAGYCQLAARSGIEITEGADDQAEMGAFHNLFQPQRESNLRGSLQEYLRFGLQAGIFHAS
jgi:hypothetical protein